MRIRWTLFGREITVLEFGEPDIEFHIPGITGGSCHNFERAELMDPQDKYREEEERFGFRC